MQHVSFIGCHLFDRLKIGLAAGAMDAFVVGGSEAKQFALTGQAINDVNYAQNLAVSGSVILSPLAQEACRNHKCQGRTLKSGYMQVHCDLAVTICLSNNYHNCNQPDTSHQHYNCSQ